MPRTSCISATSKTWTPSSSRGQLLWKPGDGWRIRGIFDYTDDDSNGMNAVAVEGGTTSCETSYLRTNCTRPWSNLRAYLGLTDPRQSMPQSVTLKDSPRRQQYLTRTGHGATLDIAKELSWATFNSLTGYRSVKTSQLFDQPGVGVEALGYSVPAWLAYLPPSTPGTAFGLPRRIKGQSCLNWPTANRPMRIRSARNSD